MSERKSFTAQLQVAHFGSGAVVLLCHSGKPGDRQSFSIPDARRNRIDFTFRLYRYPEQPDNLDALSLNLQVHADRSCDHAGSWGSGFPISWCFMSAA